MTMAFGRADCQASWKLVPAPEGILESRALVVGKGKNKHLLAIPVDMQLAASNYGRQFVVRLQRKPYIVVWPILLEEFSFKVRTHVAGINLHRLPL